MAFAAIRSYASVVEVQPKRAAFRNIHRKGRLADGRTRRAYDHFGLLQPLELLVEVLEPRRTPLEGDARRREHRVDPVEAVVHRGGPRHRPAALDAYFEEGLLRLAQDSLRIGVLALVVALRDDVRRAGICRVRRFRSDL